MKEGFQGERQIVLPPMVVRMMESDRLLSALHITDIGYYPAASHHEVRRATGIAQYIFIYCVNGKGWYEVDGVCHEVKSNHYFIIPNGSAHRYGADKDEPWTIYWIHFNGSLAPCYADDAVTPKAIKPEIHSRISNRQNIFEEIFSTLNRGFSQEHLCYSSALFHYYLGSLRYVNQYREARTVGGDDAAGAEGLVDAIIHFMEENKEKHLTMEMLSRYSGYSASYISMVFHRQTGMAPLAYFTKMKVEDACYLLDNTSMKINQICYKLGVEDSYYFSRLFAKHMGMSPRAYRNRNTKDENAN